MLLNFLGTPQSGKTTTAAMLFSKLKENHMVTDLVLEQARVKIAENRVSRGSSDLTQEDQLDIFNKQFHLETTFTKSSPNSLIISDTSVINNLLYVPDWENDSYRISKVEELLKTFKPLIFVCLPFDTNIEMVDSHRIHSLQESIQLHTKFLKIFEFFNISPIEISGTPTERLMRVFDKVLQKIFEEVNA